MIQVTMREWTTLTYITLYSGKWGIAPTASEIMRGCGRCRSETMEVLDELEHAKLVNVSGGLYRIRKQSDAILVMP